MARYDGVQLLRAIAALAVVAAHCTATQVTYAARGWSAAPAFDASAGTAGVDLFFVISGFIMASISRFYGDDAMRARVFLVRRIVRIVPVYWLYTSALLAFCLALPQIMHMVKAEPAHVLASYLFVPYPRSDGMAYPLVWVGWTLNLEMAFYLVFGVSLCFARRTRIALVYGAILAMAAAGALLRPEAWWQRWWLEPMYLEFLYGLAIGWLAYRGARLPEWLAWALIVGGLGLMPLVAGAVELRAITWGACAFLVVLGAVSIRRRLPAFVLLLGDASYSIYLSHIVTVPAASRALARFVENPVTSFFLALAAGTVGGVVAYWLLERPLLEWLKRRRKEDGRDLRYRTPALGPSISALKVD